MEAFSASPWPLSKSMLVWAHFFFFSLMLPPVGKLETVEGLRFGGRTDGQAESRFVHGLGNPARSVHRLSNITPVADEFLVNRVSYREYWSDYRFNTRSIDLVW